MKRYKHYIFDWGDTLMVDFPLETGPMYAWSKVEVVPGADTLLAELTKFAECSLATNAIDSTEEDIRKALVRVNLDNHIKNIFCFQNTGFKKPSNDFFQSIKSSLKTNPKQVIVIGDNLEQDVMGALSFGFNAIWYNANGTGTPEGINSIKHLSQILDS